MDYYSRLILSESLKCHSYNDYVMLFLYVLSCQQHFKDFFLQEFVWFLQELYNFNIFVKCCHMWFTKINDKRISEKILSRIITNFKHWSFQGSRVFYCYFFFVIFWELVNFNVADHQWCCIFHLAGFDGLFLCSKLLYSSNTEICELFLYTNW